MQSLNYIFGLRKNILITFLVLFFQIYDFDSPILFFMNLVSIFFIFYEYGPHTFLIALLVPQNCGSFCTFGSPLSQSPQFFRNVQEIYDFDQKCN